MSTPSATGPVSPPRRVAVVGAGMVGLSTAWFLQEAGAEVTVVERTGVAAGASWGNAGWLTPSLAAPLPEPAVLRYGLGALARPGSPVYVPLRADGQLLRFLASFARHSTRRRWRRAMAELVPLNERALEAFDVLAAGGVSAPAREAAPFLACYRRPAERDALLHELQAIRAAGQSGVAFEALSGERARALEPALSDRVGAAVRLLGQRFIHPPDYLRALADSFRQRGGELALGEGVTSLRADAGGVVLATGAGEQRYDAAVVATGAELGRLAGGLGVRTPVQAGRGYSFSVPVDRMPGGPVYFPAQRVACTPLGDRLRVAGMMEFRRHGDPLDPRRVTAIVDAARPFLAGADLGDRRDEWVGSRPCTPDGLPLLGATASPRVFVAGGHGMWGIALGPVSGLLLAETVMKGETPPELRPFDPLR